MLDSTVHDDDYDDDHAGGCDIGGCTCNHIRYLMFNTITAATAMVIMVVLVVIMVAGTDYEYA